MSTAVEFLVKELAALAPVSSQFDEAFVRFMNITSPEAIADACMSEYHKSASIDAASTRRRLSRTAIGERGKFSHFCFRLNKFLFLFFQTL